MRLYRGRHRRPVQVPMHPDLIAVEAVGVALRHMGAIPGSLMGPWDDRLTPDEAWVRAEIDATDWRAAS